MNFDVIILALMQVFDAKIVYFLTHRVGAIESRDPDVVGDIRRGEVRAGIVLRLRQNAGLAPLTMEILGKSCQMQGLAAPWKREVSAYLADLLDSGRDWQGEGEKLLRVVDGRCQG